MLKSKQFLIGVAISLIALFFALRNEDFGQVARALTHANYLAFIPALALYFIGVWIRAVRWRLLLKPITPRIKLGRTFDIVVIGYMANNVLPARIGELVRAYVLSIRESVRKTAALATILVERIFDGIVMVGFAAAVILFVTIFDPALLTTGEGHNFGNLLTNQSGLIGLVAVLFIGALAVFIAIASSRARAERALSFGLRFLPGRLHDRVNRIASSFIDGLGSLRSASGLLGVFGLSVLAWLFEASMYYVLGTMGFSLTANGAPVPFYVYVLATAMINLGTLVPQAPGYVGVFEFIAKGVLVGAFGVNSADALSYVLVLHATLLVPVTLLGFFYLARESMSWSDLAGLEKSRAQAADRAHELEGPLTDIELAEEEQVAGEGAAVVPAQALSTVQVRDNRMPGSGGNGAGVDARSGGPTTADGSVPTAAESRPKAGRPGDAPGA